MNIYKATFLYSYDVYYVGKNIVKCFRQILVIKKIFLEILNLHDVKFK